MIEIRLTVKLSDNVTITARVDNTSRILGSIKELLFENSLRQSLEELQLLKNGTEIISFNQSFADAGCKNGDRLELVKNSRKVIEEDDLGSEPVTPRTFHHLGIFLLDGSESMSETIDGKKTLADDVNTAMREFLGFFKNSSIHTNFSIAVITFDDRVKVHTNVTELAAIDDNANYDPSVQHGGGTNIGGALNEAQKLANAFLNDAEAKSIPHEVTVIVLSDGLCQYADETVRIAERIKQNPKITICSSLFTTVAKISDPTTGLAKTVLSDIASDANCYKTTYKESDLRKFFRASLSTKRYGKTNR